MGGANQQMVSRQLSLGGQMASSPMATQMGQMGSPMGQMGSPMGPMGSPMGATGGHPQPSPNVMRPHHVMAHGGPSPNHSPAAGSPQVLNTSASPSPATTPDPRASPGGYNCVTSGNPNTPTGHPALMGATSPLHHLNHNHNNNNGRSSAGPTPPSLPSPGGTDSQGSSAGGQSGGMGPGGSMMAPPSPATTPQPMNSSNHLQQQQQQQPSPVSGLNQNQQNHLQQQQPSPQQRLQANGGSPSKLTLIFSNTEGSDSGMGGGGMSQMGGGQAGGGAPKTIKVVALPKGNLISTVKLQVKTVESVEGSGGVGVGGGLKRKMDESGVAGVGGHPQPPAKVVKQ
ncbi:hypothetical protein BIW11_11721 [Tropilaelaps mercedesae]|uniref:Uncharacterized protein n=1 Tax=Tropilaelaps mercedesae TaxID=418985 RepID=A0A1V9XA73_9ACAR|nr:hypothetical protein BIW11_11721 [Tropilaelaps mercedesae]